jgi:hypothetical protein
MRHISIRHLVIPSLFLISLLTTPARVFAQDATITGTITDATGGVLPGVTVTASPRGDRQHLRGSHGHERRFQAAGAHRTAPCDR